MIIAIGTTSADCAGPRRPCRHVRQRWGRRRGFTLVEVLAAMVMVAIVMPVIMHAISMATQAASTSVRRTTAASLCASKLEELVATQQWQTGNLSGDFSEDGYPDYQWTAQLQNWNQPGVSMADLGQQTLSEFDVTVTWQARNTKRSVTLSTLVYSNTPLGPAATPPTNTEPRRGPSQGNVSGGGSI